MWGFLLPRKLLNPAIAPAVERPSDTHGDTCQALASDHTRGPRREVISIPAQAYKGHPLVACVTVELWVPENLRETTTSP